MIPLVSRLAGLWKKDKKRIDTMVFFMPEGNAEASTEASLEACAEANDNMKDFIDKYDAVQKQLSSIAGMDDLLSGDTVRNFKEYNLCCMFAITFISVIHVHCSVNVRDDKQVCWTNSKSQRGHACIVSFKLR